MLLMDSSCPFLVFDASEDVELFGALDTREDMSTDVAAAEDEPAPDEATPENAVEQPSIDCAIDLQTNCRFNMDTCLVDDRSNLDPRIQQWAFEQLCSYLNNSVSSIDVFKHNISYFENAERKLLTSDHNELSQKAYIIDKAIMPSLDKIVPKDDRLQPSYLSITGFRQGLHPLPGIGDSNLKMGCIGGCWRLFRSSLSVEAINEDYMSDVNRNPDRIKVWAFYLFSARTLEKAQLHVAKHSERRIPSKNDIAAKKDFPILCIVTPSNYQPVSLRYVARTLMKL